MNRRAGTCPARQRRVPHTRGDEPLIEKRTAPPLTCSPHAGVMNRLSAPVAPVNALVLIVAFRDESGSYNALAKFRSNTRTRYNKFRAGHDCLASRIPFLLPIQVHLNFFAYMPKHKERRALWATGGPVNASRPRESADSFLPLVQHPRARRAPYLCGGALLCWRVW